MVGGGEGGCGVGVGAGGGGWGRGGRSVGRGPGTCVRAIVYELYAVMVEDGTRFSQLESLKAGS